MQPNVIIDRAAASRLGVQVQDIDDALNDAFAQRQIATVYTPRNQYRVVIEIDPNLQRIAEGSRSGLCARKRPECRCRYRRSARLRRAPPPLVINHQGQFPSVTITYNLAPDMMIADATQAITKAMAGMHLPDGLQADFAGDARAFQASAGAQPLLIIAALLAVYIVLGVLYESLAHPLTIISTLPSAGLGALLALQWTHTDLSVIAFIGIILLIGIVKKNGIMLVDFALDAERRRGPSPCMRSAKPACERFRPIFMTTLAALSWRNALDHRHRAGFRFAAAARHHDCRRAARLAGADALHDAGDLSLPRQAAQPPPAAGGRAPRRSGKRPGGISTSRALTAL